MVSEAVARGDIAALNYFVAEKYIKAFEHFAHSPNQKIIMLPIEAMNVLGSLAGIGEIAKATFGGDVPKGGDGKAPPAPGVGMAPSGPGTNVAATPERVFMLPPNGGPVPAPPVRPGVVIRRIELQPAPPVQVAPRVEK